MSGGSYDYLCFQEFTVKAIELSRMADRLYELGYHDASDETQRVLSVMRGIDEDARLREAWRAVEWLDSGDAGIEQLHVAMEARGWRYAAATP